jgi:hypothetical protein
MPAPQKKSVRGGLKAGLLLWLLGAPLIVILIGYAAC